MQLELGIELMEGKRKKDIEKDLFARLSDTPEGYKILMQMRMKGEHARWGKYSRLAKTAQR